MVRVSTESYGKQTLSKSTQSSGDCSLPCLAVDKRLYYSKFCQQKLISENAFQVTDNNTTWTKKKEAAAPRSALSHVC